MRTPDELVSEAQGLLSAHGIDASAEAIRLLEQARHPLVLRLHALDELVYRYLHADPNGDDAEWALAAMDLHKGLRQFSRATEHILEVEMKGANPNDEQRPPAS